MNVSSFCLGLRLPVVKNVCWAASSLDEVASTAASVAASSLDVVASSLAESDIVA